MTARRLVLVAWLTLVWCLLWSDAHPGTVLAGLGVAFAVALVARPATTGGHAVRPVHALRFAGWFLRALVASTFTVARTSLRPRPALREAIVAVPVHGTTALLTTIVANTITLTPGTLTLEARPRGDGDATGMLHIHVLALTTPEELHAEVAHIEELVVRAFGPPAAVAELDHPVPPLPRPTAVDTEER